ncbi:unnamed protein product, partial [Mesorhabditis belari]|uniref:sphinganine-1-phosphate aldolase n=1 Tax=Mesorhabditis belari TaxID=2138241 RepID=A0AAF3J9T0_9BILA
MLSEGVKIVKEHAVVVHESVTNQLKKVDPVLLVIGTIAGTLVYLKTVHLYTRSDQPLHKRLMAWGFQKFRRLPAVKRKIEKELEKPKLEILESIHKDDVDRQFIAAIPEESMSQEDLLQLAEKYDNYGKFDVANGKVSGTVYTDRTENHMDLMEKIYRRYAYSNPLHPDVFPGVRKMEAEVIKMVISLYHGPSESSGSMTTGGTESIIMACFAYRNRAHSLGISDPVIVCPVTAHAAFDKAAHLCGMRIRHVSVDKDNRVNLRELERSIDGNTCMLVGSAPNFPSGTVDPIPEISKLGLKYNIPVHVDACLGGFLIPFMKEAGFPLPVFDFGNPGVMSISCDTHKYGCTPKGSSIVMYRNHELHHYQYFSIPEWTGGIYATPTICGSRAGANAAVAWATLLSFGRQEYVMRCRRIVESAKRLADGISKIPGLQLMGIPDVSVVAFHSTSFNIYAVGDRMTKKGYSLNALQNPDAIHVCLTYNHAKNDIIDGLVADLRSVCQEVESLPDKGNKSSTAALYGLAAGIPDKTLVDEMTAAYMDACYAAPPPHH